MKLLKAALRPRVMINQSYDEDQNYTMFHFCNPYAYKEAFVFYGILYPAIAILMVITNVIVAGVFLRQKKKSPTTVLLIGLAIADAGVGAVTVPLHIYYHSLQNYMFTMEYPGCIYYHVAPVVSTILHTVSVWVTTVLGVQRYLVVSHPFLGPKYCTIKVSVIVLVCVYILATVMYFPQFFYHQFKETHVDNGYGYMVYVCECWQTEVPAQYESKLKILKLSVAKLIPCIILGITTILLVKRFDTEVRQSGSLHADHHRPEREFRETRLIRRTSLMIAVIVICCLAVEVPSGLRFLIKTINAEAIDPETDLFLIAVLNVCTLLNFHINFWIYVCLSQEFRRILRGFFCRWNRKYQKVHLISQSSMKTTTENL
ncbi:sex peptide receptor-like isoform X2 [Saccostrea cucullata]|uniref:sex peptide receptor-like isoform X2 n=1 Tax=Saccostrea cuccullata TaxID=36930 RepID=UPI002ED0361A